MSRFPHLCTRCNTVVPAKQECACQRQAKRARGQRHDRNRKTAAQRGYNYQWRKASKQFLRTFTNCALCNAPATLVDHITPHKGDQTLFWNEHNWQPLCTTCHSKQKQRQEHN